MSLLKRAWERWKRIARVIARFNSIVICTVIYVLILPLAAVPFRLTKDPLRLKGAAGFMNRDAAEATLEEASRQG